MHTLRGTELIGHFVCREPSFGTKKVRLTLIFYFFCVFTYALMYAVVPAIRICVYVCTLYVCIYVFIYVLVL